MFIVLGSVSFLVYLILKSESVKLGQKCITRMNSQYRAAHARKTTASSCKQYDLRVCHACAVHHTSLRIQL